MPTIKTKKEMHLGELLCWAIENKEQASLKDFYSKNIGVKFNASGYPCIEFEKKFLPTYETFTVEIEEEITEDTVIPKAIAVFKHTTDLYTDRLFSKSINEILKLDDKVTSSDTKTIYVLNNDGTLTLIWTKEKGMVE
ncbi:MAG: hypothetical protein ACTH2V_01135 [Mammaliicoccus sciuri]